MMKKILFKALREIGIIKDDQNWELHIGGNKDGIRFIRYTTSID